MLCQRSLGSARQQIPEQHKMNNIPGLVKKPELLREKFVLLWVFISFSVAAASFFQAFGESQDWENYIRILDSIRAEGLMAEGVERIEIGFKFISAMLIGMSLSNGEIYAVFVAASLLLKCVAVNGVAIDRGAFSWGILFYVVSIAPLHELTQLRAALSISFLFLAYAALINKRIGSVIIASALAAVFHMSALIIFPALLIVYFFEKSLLKITPHGIIYFATGFYFLITAIAALAIAYFEDVFLVVSAYQELGFGDEAVNPFAPSVILTCVFIFGGLILWPDITPNMRYILGFQAIGLSFFFATSVFQVIAFRVLELFQAFTVFFVVEGVRSASCAVRFFSLSFILMALAAYSYIYFFSGRFFI